MGERGLREGDESTGKPGDEQEEADKADKWTKFVDKRIRLQAMADG